MKERFAAFLVNKSKIILVIFIILGLGCAALIPFVNVNQDMTKYLPKDSSMRHGLDIMRAEFGDEDASELLVMFADLKTKDEKIAIRQEFEAIHNVDYVDYEPGDKDYNKDGYTLYKINCDYKSYSDQAAGIRNEVIDNYAEAHEITLGGSIDSSNDSGLPLWIAIVAVMLVFLILAIMANAWIEPLAILISTGIAIFINMGTYVLFPDISKTTFTIVALLQLVLSMDYSIMLLNRYRQQRALTDDKYEAMKQSLSLSFGAITGSSLTTFAGLFALIFMSFTIGADVGISLAKGVIISLICIFTTLPALLLGFDNLITRTAKRTLPFHLPRLSRAQFKLRIPLTLLFAALLVTGFMVRNDVDFSYAQYTNSSDIEKVFGYDNTIVMIYNEKDSAAAEALAADLDGNAPVKSAICYESTIGKSRTAGDMKSFLDDMQDDADGGSGSGIAGSSGFSSNNSFSGDTDLTTRTVRLIYYDYFKGEPDFTLTIPQFVSYLRGSVMSDPDFRDSIDDDMRSQVDDMAKYTDPAALTTKMGAAGLADFFGMTTHQAKQLLLYYQIKRGSASGGTMTVPGFIRFLINDVAKDPDYGSMIDSDQLAQLKSVRKFTSKKKTTTPFVYMHAARFLGMDEDQMRLVYVNYYAKSRNPSPMSIADLATTLQSMASDPMLASQFGGSDMAQLIAGLQQVGQMDPGVYDVGSMVNVLAMYGMPLDQETLALIYAYRDVTETPYQHKMKVRHVVSFMLSDKDISSSMSSSQKKQLRRLHAIIEASVKGKHLSASKMADLLGMKKSDARSVYLLRQYKKGNTSSWKLSPQQFINFLADDVLNDASMKSRVGSNADELLAARKLINNSVNGTAYTYSQLSDFLEELGDALPGTGSTSGTDGGGSTSDGDGGNDFDPDSIRMIYELYGADNYYDKSWRMDLVTMIHHLDGTMAERPAFARSMTDSQISDLHDMRADLDDAVDLLRGEHYGRMIITANLPEDSDETRAFMDRLTAATGTDLPEPDTAADSSAAYAAGSDNKGSVAFAPEAFASDAFADVSFSEPTYLIGNTPMAYEMSRTFHSELNRVTLLTALFILFIVLLTFRRAAASVILVLVIQCAVFLTMTVLSLLHVEMNYLALLIVQSIMMGATIDYAIIYTSYYIENRLKPAGAVFATGDSIDSAGLSTGTGASSLSGGLSGGLSPFEAILASYKGSLQTILTSSTVLIVAVGILSFAFSEPATRQICRILSVGCLIATLLVIFILPAILACLDRLIIRRK